MKGVFLYICAFLFISPVTDIHLVRKTFKEASKSKAKLEALHQLLSTVSQKSTSTLLAYKGAALALNAKYESKVKQKKDFFVKGITILEAAIKKDTTAVEPRLIRLSIQENTPKFLNYKAAIKKDKALLLSKFKFIKDKSLKKIVAHYISQSKIFSNQEKALILQ